MRKTLGALTMTGLLVAAGCGDGDDSFPRDEFVKMVAANGVTEEVADCTYDAIVDDDAIMEELKRTGGPTNEISDAAARRLSRVIAACLLGLETDDVDSIGATTTAPPTTVIDETTTTAEDSQDEDADANDSRTTTTRQQSTRTTTTVDRN